MMNREIYLSELATQLQCRGVDEQRIGEIIAEVESHLNDSGESPEDAFGPAEKYAEKMAVFSENTQSPAFENQWHLRTFKATAFDEMGILTWAGQEGWELLDVGPYALNCRRPISLHKGFHWQYKRRTGTDHKNISAEMKANNWEPCGRWIVFHYFKRKVANLELSEIRKDYNFGQK